MFKKTGYFFFLLQSLFLTNSAHLHAVEMTGTQKAQLVTGFLRAPLVILASQQSDVHTKKKAFYVSLAASIRILDAVFDMCNHKELRYNFQYVLPWLGYDCLEMYKAIFTIIKPSRQKNKGKIADGEEAHSLRAQATSSDQVLAGIGLLLPIIESLLQLQIAISSSDNQSDISARTVVHGVSSIVRLGNVACNVPDKTGFMKAALAILFMANVGCLIRDGHHFAVDRQRELEERVRQARERWEQFFREEAEHRRRAYEDLERVRRQYARNPFYPDDREQMRREEAEAASERQREDERVRREEAERRQRAEAERERQRQRDNWAPQNQEFRAQQAAAQLRLEEYQRRWGQLNQAGAVNRDEEMRRLQSALLNDEGNQAARLPLATLGLFQGASVGEVKKAYRNLSKIHHVDKHFNSPQSTAITQRLNAAYEALKAQLHFN